MASFSGRIEPIQQGYPASGGGGTVSVTAPLTGDGSSGTPVAIPAATNAVSGYATSTQITQLESNTTAIAALQAALPLVIRKPKGSATTASGFGTANLFSGWTPANGKKYNVRTMVWGVAGNGETGMIVLETLVWRDAPSTYINLPAMVSTPAVSQGDLSVMQAVYGQTGGELRIACTGIAAMTMDWGAVFQITELPNS